MSPKYTVHITYAVSAELALRAKSPLKALRLAARLFADESTADQFAVTRRTLHTLSTTVGEQHYQFPATATKFPADQEVQS